jgi:hypothetical protein
MLFEKTMPGLWEDKLKMSLRNPLGIENIHIFCWSNSVLFMFLCASIVCPSWMHFACQVHLCSVLAEDGATVIAMLP